MTEVGNPELLLFSLWRLSAVGKYVEIEDIFQELFTIAPSRFSWRTRKLPSDKIGDQALRDAYKKHGKGLILASKDRNSLQLTADGVRWVQERLDQFQALVEDGAPPAARGSHRALSVLEAHPLVKEYASGGDASDISRLQLAGVLRLTPDADGRAWRERVETYKSAAQLAGRDLVLRFLKRLESDHPDWLEVER